MILVDTSVWIDYFNDITNSATDKLDACLGNEMVAIGDIILLEVLQGFRSDKDYQTAKNLMESLTIYEMLGKQAVYGCAENYRKLRKKGITIRKTTDVIIASFCIKKDLPLLFTDKDFEPFVKNLGLKSAGG